MHSTGNGCTYDDMRSMKNQNYDGIDRLTGLYNGEYALKEIQAYMEQNPECTAAVYIMDIDNFRTVDETLGRLFGNEIMKEIAAAICQVFGKQAVIGRIGGDKFLIFEKNYESVGRIRENAKELCHRARSTFKGEDQNFVISLSIGIAIMPDDGYEWKQLAQHATQALTYVKNHGKDGYEFYNSEMDTVDEPADAWMQKNKSLYISGERGADTERSFDSFGYELMDLAFQLIEDTANVANAANAINLLIRKVGLHYGMNAVAVRELINKPRTLRYMYEYVDSRAIPNRKDSEWQYNMEEWKTFKDHFKTGYYLYYNSEGIDFDIPEIQSKDFLFQTFLEVPVIRSGEIVGCVDYITFDREIHYSAQDLSTLKMFTKLISSYLFNAKSAYQADLKMEDLNDHDMLTGLMKYTVFKKKLNAALKSLDRQSNIVIIYSDLRHFKYINDTYGYDVGNNLLKMFCTKTIRDVKGLIGGARVYSDNIVIAAQYPEWFADERIYQEILKKNNLLNSELQDAFMDNNINICTGIFIVKNPKIDMEIALSNVNMARKEAKKKERNTVVLFDDEMMQSVVRQMQLNAELPNALENGNIKVYYQPKIESGTGKIVGAEALVRWQKEDGTFIYPDEFIPGFEENGMIVEMDYYVYENVFIEIKKRIDEGLPLVPISMNISSVHLKEGELMDYINYLFDKYPIPAKYVEFELTESIYIENLEAALELINSLRSKGIRISMDDFGSGYSSLNLLNNLPIDILKLDKIFLNGDDLTANQKIIISCIIEMAAKLNIRVVCEGVETSEQVNFLTVIGCDMIQGYYYAKPMPQDDFNVYMDEHIKVKPTVVCFPFDGDLKSTDGKFEAQCLGGTPEYCNGVFCGKKALCFKGGDIMQNVISVPTKVYTNASYTMSCWIQTDNVNRWSTAVTMEFENGFNSIMPNAGDLKADFRIKLSNENEDIWHDTGCEIYPDVKWHMYTVTYNAQTKVAILYIDAMIGGYMESVDMLNGINRILVGGDIYTTPLNGKVAELKFYNQSLSKTDVGQLYKEECASR